MYYNLISYNKNSYSKKYLKYALIQQNKDGLSSFKPNNKYQT